MAPPNHDVLYQFAGRPAFDSGYGRYGHTEAKLTAEQALIMAVHTMNAAQEREKGDAPGGHKLDNATVVQIGPILHIAATVASAIRK